MKVFRMIVKLLLIIGALNWGSIALFQYDAVASLMGGPMMMGTRIVYGLVGLAGLIALIKFFRRCCGSCGCGSNCACGGKCGGNCGCRKP